MSKINLNNYEAYLLDYFEGSLNELDCNELKGFIKQNPQLNIDFEDFNLPILKVETNEFEIKNSLKKNKCDYENQVIISYLENCLPAEELLEFEQKLSVDFELQNTLTEFKKTYFKKDLSKEKLNKNQFYISNNYKLQLLIFNYFEGNLNQSEKIKFEDDLISNKFLQNEIKLYSKTKLVAENEKINKSNLYKSEGGEIINLTHENELLNFPTTINQSDLKIIYPNKNDLKKSTTKIITLFNSFKFVAVAASVLLVITFLFKLLVPQTYYGKSFYSNNFKFYSPNLLKVSQSNTTNNSNLLSNSFKSSHQYNVTNSVIKNYNFNNVITDSLVNQTTKLLVKPTVKKDSLINSIDVNIASKIKTDTIIYTEKLEPLLVIKEIKENEEDDFETIIPVKKSNFWSKAVNLANNLNILGFKTLKAKENNNNYSIAYKSFVIEKK
ncbi:MAG: hypothetical protein LCH32_04365 [Bacteroidetes bacterium]|nr:hypothetical protein [Bacteroidota bacterium]